MARLQGESELNAQNVTAHVCTRAQSALPLLLPWHSGCAGQFLKHSARLLHIYIHIDILYIVYINIQYTYIGASAGERAMSFGVIGRSRG